MSHVELATFDNGTGEGIVSFEPSRTSGPEYDADHSRWYHHLLVAGQRVFEYGCPCGTCGIVFRKVGTSAHRVGDSEAFRLLGHLDSVPSNEILRRLARVLQPGFYHPAIVEGTVRLIEPGAPADYFASDVVRLSGPDARSVRILIPCSGRAVVVPQKPAQPLAATNVSAIARERFWRDQVVPEPLMIPLSMVVGHELVEDTDQAPFPEENQAVETLLANRAHEPFRVGVGVRRLDGREDDANPRAFHDVSESLGPLAVPVADEDPMARQEPLDGVGETTRRLGHECGIGIGR